MTILTIFIILNLKSRLSLGYFCAKFLLDVINEWSLIYKNVTTDEDGERIGCSFLLNESMRTFVDVVEEAVVVVGVGVTEVSCFQSIA